MGVIIILIGLLSVNFCIASDELPCNFLDSINITGGNRFLLDESIEFNSIVYKRTQYARINYILENGIDKVIVDPYIRGCICNIRACIRLCCPLGTLHTRTLDGMTVCRDHEKGRNLHAEIVHENNETEIVPLHNYFSYVEGHPCKFLYFDDKFKISRVRINSIQPYILFILNYPFNF